MRNLIGVSAKFFTCLSQCKINVEMISQGASEINISCVINIEKSVEALNAIHEGLINV